MLNVHPGRIGCVRLSGVPRHMACHVSIQSAGSIPFQETRGVSKVDIAQSPCASDGKKITTGRCAGRVRQRPPVVIESIFPLQEMAMDRAQLLAQLDEKAALDFLSRMVRHKSYTETEGERKLAA